MHKKNNPLVESLFVFIPSTRLGPLARVGKLERVRCCPFAPTLQADLQTGVGLERNNELHLLGHTAGDSHVTS